MAKADDARESRTGARKAKRSPREGLWAHSLVAIGVAGVGLLAAFGLVWFQIIFSVNQTHKEALTQAVQANYVGYFNGRITTLQEQVNALAVAPDTVALLANYDGTGTLATKLADNVGYGLRVEVIPKGKAQVDLNHEIPISFAALDLIRRAENQPFVGPEVSLSQQRLVYAGQPITSDGVVAGVLFLIVSADYFFEPLKAFDLGQGRIKIQQQFEGTPPTVVMEFGVEGDALLAQKTILKASHWTLIFEPAPSVVDDLSGALDLLTPLGVAIGLLLGGVMLAFSRHAAHLQMDLEVLTAYVSRLIRGRSTKLDIYKLPLIQHTANALSRFDKTPRKAEGGKRKKQSKQAIEDELLSELDEGEDDDDKTVADGNFLEVNPAEDANENFGIEVSEEGVSPVEMGLHLDDEIFRAYDIRGIVDKNLTEDVVYWIGRAFAAEASAKKQPRVTVGYDGRNSSPMLRDALTRGLTEGGLDVIDVGQVPTPLLYFTTFAMDTGTGIMITGSHNPPEYNGLKMVLAGVTLAEDAIQQLKTRILENDLSEGEGDSEEMDLADHYIDRILEDVAVAQPLKVVVDCGNGVAGLIAPRLIRELGCEVVELYCEVDGDFPNHHPDPADPANLDDLITVVKAENAALGIAFDGDGDRIGVVTAAGEIIWPDKLLMLFAQDIVGRNPGTDIIYDVKCSRHLNTLISEFGGRPIMCKTGHSHIKAKMKETGALLGGEFSGHICFGERWYGFDDAIYSAARLIEILGSESRSIDEVFSQFPVTYSTPEIKIATTETKKFKVIEALAESADFGDGALTTIDGLRVDYSDGWGLIRPSNTSPVLSLRFEADAPSALERIQETFQAQLAAVDPELKFL